VSPLRVQPDHKGRQKEELEKPEDTLWKPKGNFMHQILLNEKAHDMFSDFEIELTILRKTNPPKGFYILCAITQKW